MRPIDFDVACAGCQYNLRGRPALGRCPECGTLIEVFAALGLGTGLFLLAGSQGVGVLALYGVTVVGIAIFTRIDPSDGVWFLLVIAALRLPHLL